MRNSVPRGRLDASVGYVRPRLYTATYVDSETPIAGRTDTFTVVPVTLGRNFRTLRESRGTEWAPGIPEQGS